MKANSLAYRLIHETNLLNLINLSLAYVYIAQHGQIMD
jgi:hypothetical protein